MTGCRKEHFMNNRDELIRRVADTISSQDDSAILPDRNRAVEILHDLQALMFPAFFGGESMSRVTRLHRIIDVLQEQIQVCADFARRPLDAAAAAEKYIEEIPSIRSLLQKDITALYEGDPAATSPQEVLLSYPGIYAIMVYRLAHPLYTLGVPILPRILTEHAHAKTGIDIHPGATIGEYFFIDHGTGIVIGETTTIGNHVKLYQGVTLGAKSFETDENGNPVKGVKRHPDIGSNVVIYANATILGGLTRVGDGCVIGGNVWLTRSVPEGTTVIYNCGQDQMMSSY